MEPHPSSAYPPFLYSEALAAGKIRLLQLDDELQRKKTDLGEELMRFTLTKVPLPEKCVGVMQTTGSAWTAELEDNFDWKATRILFDEIDDFSRRSGDRYNLDEQESALWCIQ
jgi:hypothetical protein